MARYFALSRTTHGLLDIAAPAFCALLWLGGFPPLPTILLALFAAFSAYTATYTLNDLVGIRVDRLKFAEAGINPGYSVEASAQRYPLAQNLIGIKGGLIWMAIWFTFAFISSYFLNPVIVLILFLAAILEIIYCMLLKVTYLRILVSGLVKTSGPIAAIFAVDAHPSAGFIVLLFIWLFFWEVGGQNIPADWNDTVEDRRVNAKTIPLRFGFKRAGAIVMMALALTVVLSCFLPLISPAPLGVLYIIGSLLSGYFLLLKPGFQLYRSRGGSQAGRLFDKASFYPFTQLVLIAGLLITRNLIQ